MNSKNDYFSFCNKYIFYYICQRNNDHLKYNININNGCPQEKSDSILSNIGDIFIILNIIFGCVPWSFELFFIKKYLNKNENNESEDQNENNNHIIINIEQSRNLNQIRNIFNRTTNSSDINIQRPTSNEIVNINEEINETINNNNIIKNTNSNESIKYIFVGKETTKNAIYNDSEEDEKEKEKIKIKNNRDYKLNINLIKSPHKDTETNNFETNNNNKNPTSMKEIVLLNKKNNLFSLKKNINDNDNDLIFIQKHKRFINSNNKTLNVIQTHFNIVLNKKKDFSYNIKDLNKSDCETNKKINNNTLDLMDQNCLSCKKEKNKEYKNKVINLTRTVKRNKKEKNKIMDNIWKILENQSNLKKNLKKEQKNKFTNSQ